MKVSSFVNDPDGTPLHSSGLAGDTAPAAQSYTERRKIEQQRRIIKGYRHSLLGANFGGDRGRITSPQRPVTPENSQSPDPSRQQQNAVSDAPAPPPQNFKEPPTRGFNPYS